MFIRSIICLCIVYLCCLATSAVAFESQDGLLMTVRDVDDGTTPIDGMVVPLIDDDWGLESPHADVAADNFRISWNGYLLAPSSGLYTITVRCDDRVGLWVADEKRIGSWGEGSLQDHSFTMEFVEGRYYDMYLSYTDLSAESSIQMRWSAADRVDEVIGSEWFVTAANNHNESTIDHSESQYGLTGTYWTNIEGSGYPAKRIDGVIDFYYENRWNVIESPMPGFPEDNYRVEWDGFLVPEQSGDYTIRFKANDGVRLWLNDELRIDQWDTESPGLYDESFTCSLEASVPQRLHIEYMELERSAIAQLLWTPPGSSQSGVIPQEYLRPITLESDAVAASFVSPAFVEGRKAVDANVRIQRVDQHSFDGVESVPVRALSDTSFYGDVPLYESGIATDYSITVETTDLGLEQSEGSITWQPTLINGDNATYLRAGSSLLVEVPTDGQLVIVDATGEVLVSQSIAAHVPVPQQFVSPGFYRVMHQNTNGVIISTYTIMAVGIEALRTCASQVGYERELVLSGTGLDMVTPMGNDPSLVSVGSFSHADGYIRANITTHMRGSPSLVFRLAGTNGAVVGIQEIEEFTVDVPMLDGLWVDSLSRIGTESITIHPYIPDLTVRIHMGGSRATMRGGARELYLDTGRLNTPATTGDDPMRIAYDAVHDENIGVMNFDIEMSDETTRFCVRAWVYQDDYNLESETNTGSTDVGSTIERVQLPLIQRQVSMRIGANGNVEEKPTTFIGWVGPLVSLTSCDDPTRVHDLVPVRLEGNVDLRDGELYYRIGHGTTLYPIAPLDLARGYVVIPRPLFGCCDVELSLVARTHRFDIHKKYVTADIGGEKECLADHTIEQVKEASIIVFPEGPGNPCDECTCYRVMVPVEWYMDENGRPLASVSVAITDAEGKVITVVEWSQSADNISRRIPFDGLIEFCLKTPLTDGQWPLRVNIHPEEGTRVKTNSGGSSASGFIKKSQNTDTFTWVYFDHPSYTVIRKPWYNLHVPLAATRSAGLRDKDIIAFVYGWYNDPFYQDIQLYGQHPDDIVTYNERSWVQFNTGAPWPNNLWPVNVASKMYINGRTGGSNAFHINDLVNDDDLEDRSANVVLQWATAENPNDTIGVPRKWNDPFPYMHSVLHEDHTSGETISFVSSTRAVAYQAESFYEIDIPVTISAPVTKHANIRVRLLVNSDKDTPFFQKTYTYGHGWSIYPDENTQVYEGHAFIPAGSTEGSAHFIMEHMPPLAGKMQAQIRNNYEDVHLDDTIVFNNGQFMSQDIAIVDDGHIPAVSFTQSETYIPHNQTNIMPIQIELSSPPIHAGTVDVSYVIAGVPFVETLHISSGVNNIDLTLKGSYHSGEVVYIYLQNASAGLRIGNVQQHIVRPESGVVYTGFMGAAPPSITEGGLAQWVIGVGHYSTIPVNGIDVTVNISTPDFVQPNWYYTVSGATPIDSTQYRVHLSPEQPTQTLVLDTAFISDVDTDWQATAQIINVSAGYVLALSQSRSVLVRNTTHAAVPTLRFATDSTTLTKTKNFNPLRIELTGKSAEDISARYEWRVKNEDETLPDEILSSGGPVSLEAGSLSAYIAIPAEIANGADVDCVMTSCVGAHIGSPGTHKVRLSNDEAMLVWLTGPNESYRLQEGETARNALTFSHVSGTQVYTTDPVTVTFSAIHTHPDAAFELVANENVLHPNEEGLYTLELQAEQQYTQTVDVRSLMNPSIAGLYDIVCEVVSVSEGSIDPEDFTSTITVEAEFQSVLGLSDLVSTDVYEPAQATDTVLVSFPLTLSPAPEQNENVLVTISVQGELSLNEYALVGSTQRTLNVANNYSTHITVEIFGDTRFELPEDLTCTIVSYQSEAPIYQDPAFRSQTVRILDDLSDAGSYMSLAATPTTVSEGDTLTLSIVFEPAVAHPLTCTWVNGGSSASVETDFSWDDSSIGFNKTFEISAGTTTWSTTLSITDDAVYELDEHIISSLIFVDGTVTEDIIVRTSTVLAIPVADDDALSLAFTSSELSIDEEVGPNGTNIDISLYDVTNTVRASAPYDFTCRLTLPEGSPYSFSSEEDLQQIDLAVSAQETDIHATIFIEDNLYYNQTDHSTTITLDATTLQAGISLVGGVQTVAITLNDNEGVPQIQFNEAQKENTVNEYYKLISEDNFNTHQLTANFVPPFEDISLLSVEMLPSSEEADESDYTAPESWTVTNSSLEGVIGIIDNIRRERHETVTFTLTISDVDSILSQAFFDLIIRDEDPVIGIAMTSVQQDIDENAAVGWVEVHFFDILTRQRINLPFQHKIQLVSSNEDVVYTREEDQYLNASAPLLHFYPKDNLYFNQTDRWAILRFPDDPAFEPFNAGEGYFTFLRVNIIDNELNTPPQLRLTPHFSGIEGSQLSVAISSVPALEGGMHVYVFSVGGSALKDIDFTQTSMASVFLSEDGTPAQMTFVLTEDVLHEETESFTVFVEDALDTRPFHVIPASETYSILDNEIPPIISMASSQETVLEADGAQVQLTLSLSDVVAQQEVTVTYHIETHAADIVGPAVRSCSIPAGALSTTVDLDIYNDTINEPAEQVVCRVISANIGVPSETADSVAFTILDDGDPEPVVFCDVNGQVVHELSEAGHAAITVRLSTESGYPVTVSYNTADGTAEAGSDYLAAGSNALLTIPAGSTSAAIEIPIYTDSEEEGSETFICTLHSPVTHAVLNSERVETTVTIAESPRVGFLPDSRVVSMHEGATESLALGFCDPSYGTAGVSVSAVVQLTIPEGLVYGRDFSVIGINELSETQTFSVTGIAEGAPAVVRFASHGGSWDAEYTLTATVLSVSHDLAIHTDARNSVITVLPQVPELFCESSRCFWQKVSEEGAPLEITLTDCVLASTAPLFRPCTIAYHLTLSDGVSIPGTLTVGSGSSRWDISADIAACVETAGYPVGSTGTFFLDVDALSSYTLTGQQQCDLRRKGTWSTFAFLPPRSRSVQEGQLTQIPIRLVGTPTDVSGDLALHFHVTSAGSAADFSSAYSFSHESAVSNNAAGLLSPISWSAGSRETIINLSTVVFPASTDEYTIHVTLGSQDPALAGMLLNNTTMSMTVTKRATDFTLGYVHSSSVFSADGLLDSVELQVDDVCENPITVHYNWSVGSVNGSGSCTIPAWHEFYQIPHADSPQIAFADLLATCTLTLTSANEQTTAPELARDMVIDSVSSVHTATFLADTVVPELVVEPNLRISTGATNPAHSIQLQTDLVWGMALPADTILPVHLRAQAYFLTETGEKDPNNPVSLDPNHMPWELRGEAVWTNPDDAGHYVISLANTESWQQLSAAITLYSVLRPPFADDYLIEFSLVADPAYSLLPTSVAPIFMDVVPVYIVSLAPAVNTASEPLPPTGIEEPTNFSADAPDGLLNTYITSNGVEVKIPLIIDPPVGTGSEAHVDLLWSGSAQPWLESQHVSVPTYAPGDYTLTNEHHHGSAQLTEGTETTPLPLTINGDRVDETTEQLSVSLANVSISNSDDAIYLDPEHSISSVTIIDDPTDEKILLSLVHPNTKFGIHPSTFTAVEGDAITYTAELSEPAPAGGITFFYYIDTNPLLHGELTTATPDEDYYAPTAGSNFITIEEEETEVSFTLNTILDDDNSESEEMIILGLAIAPESASIARLKTGASKQECRLFNRESSNAGIVNIMYPRNDANTLVLFYGNQDPLNPTDNPVYNIDEYTLSSDDGTTYSGYIDNRPAILTITGKSWSGGLPPDSIQDSLSFTIDYYMKDSEKLKLEEGQEPNPNENLPTSTAIYEGIPEVNVDTKWFRWNFDDPDDPNNPDQPPGGGGGVVVWPPVGPPNGGDERDKIVWESMYISWGELYESHDSKSSTLSIVGLSGDVEDRISVTFGGTEYEIGYNEDVGRYLLNKTDEEQQVIGTAIGREDGTIAFVNDAETVLPGEETNFAIDVKNKENGIALAVVETRGVGISALYYDREGKATPADHIYGVSSPTPLVGVESISVAVTEMHSGGEISGTISFSTIVTSRLCDLKPESEGTISSIKVYVNNLGEAYSTETLSVSKSEGPVGAPYPYKGSGSVYLNMDHGLKLGRNIVRIEAEDPIIHKVGVHEFAFNVSNEGGILVVSEFETMYEQKNEEVYPLAFQVYGIDEGTEIKDELGAVKAKVIKWSDNNFYLSEPDTDYPMHLVMTLSTTGNDALGEEIMAGQGFGIDFDRNLVLDYIKSMIEKYLNKNTVELGVVVSGFTVGFLEGGWTLVVGVAEIGEAVVAGGLSEISINDRSVFDYRNTANYYFGWNLETGVEKRQQVLNHIKGAVDAVFVLGTVVVKLVNDEGAYTLAEAVGDQDTLNRLDSEYKAYLSLTWELMIEITRKFAHKPPFERGQAMGKLFSEIITSVIPVTKLASISKATAMAEVVARFPVIKTQRIENLILFYQRVKMCFVAGTLIHTENGLVAIENVQIGDRVWSRNEETGEIALKKVQQTIQTHPQSVMEVVYQTVSGEGFLYVTCQHPFWVEERGLFVAAEDIKSGEHFILRNKESVEVVSASLDENYFARNNVERTTYNLVVADFHTYFVGKQGVWVHNISNNLCEDASSVLRGMYRSWHKVKNVTKNKVEKTASNFFRKYKIRTKNKDLSPDDFANAAEEFAEHKATGDLIESESMFVFEEATGTDKNAIEKWNKATQTNITDNQYGTGGLIEDKGEIDAMIAWRVYDIKHSKQNQILIATEGPGGTVKVPGKPGNPDGKWGDKIFDVYTPDGATDANAATRFINVMAEVLDKAKNQTQNIHVNLSSSREHPVDWKSLDKWKEAVEAKNLGIGNLDNRVKTLIIGVDDEILHVIDF